MCFIGIFPVSVSAQGSLLAFGRAYGPRGSGGGGGVAQGGRRIFCRILRGFLLRTLKNTCVFASLSPGGVKMLVFYDMFCSWGL